MKIQKKPKRSSFVNVQVWYDTKVALVDLLKKRNRGKVKKQSLASLVDDLAKHECITN